MDNLFKTFYQTVYTQTGGYIPVFPLTHNVHPGDFFQIRNGDFIFLGNIFNPPIVDQLEVRFEHDILLNPSSWIAQAGVSKPYSGRGAGTDVTDSGFEFSRQVLAFKERGSFQFKASNPRGVRIANWSDLADELIIKLTQTYYSFREVYVVTECAVLEDWTLAVAGAENAELEIAMESENFGLVDIFGSPSSKTIQSKDIAFFEREERKRSTFFKGKKLIVNNDQVEMFISDFLARRGKHQSWAESFYPYEFYYKDGIYHDTNVFNAKASVLDLLQGNQLNPNTALSYFNWTNTGLDDVGRLFNNNA